MSVSDGLVIGVFFFFFQAEDGIRDDLVTGVQTCALPISAAYASGIPASAAAATAAFSAFMRFVILVSFLACRCLGIQRSCGAAPSTGGEIGRASCRERV